MATTVVVTNVGKAIIAGLVSAVTALVPKYQGIGTGSHTAAAGDTALTTEVETRSGTNAPTRVTTTNTNDTFQVVQTQTATAARVLIEAALFDASTSGNMFVSATYDAINLANGDSIQLTWKVQWT